MSTRWCDGEHTLYYQFSYDRTPTSKEMSLWCGEGAGKTQVPSKQYFACHKPTNGAIFAPGQKNFGPKKDAPAMNRGVAVDRAVKLFLFCDLSVFRSFSLGLSGKRERP
jgi:hypothetical protein